MPQPAIPTIHATCVAIDGRGVLLTGPSGSGKSDLALRLIDRGAELVADDRTALAAAGGVLTASAPATIAGLIEIRGIGLVPLPCRAAPVVLVVALDRPPERMPPNPWPAIELVGIAIPTIALAAFEASAPVKVEHAVRALR